VAIATVLRFVVGYVLSPTANAGLTHFHGSPMSASNHASPPMARRLKRILAVCAISAVGVAGAAVSHAESGPPTGSLGRGAGGPELSAAGGALRVIAGYQDENVKEAAERRDRAGATGGREGRGRETAATA
jgi:hypothetical protein